MASGISVKTRNGQAAVKELAALQNMPGEPSP